MRAPDEGLRARIEAHITECPNCWVICDTTKKTIQVYKGMKPQTIPADVHARLVSAVEKKCAAKRQTKSNV